MVSEKDGLAVVEANQAPTSLEIPVETAGERSAVDDGKAETRASIQNIGEQAKITEGKALVDALKKTVWAEDPTQALVQFVISSSNPVKGEIIKYAFQSLDYLRQSYLFYNLLASNIPEECFQPFGKILKDLYYYDCVDMYNEELIKIIKLPHYANLACYLFEGHPRLFRVAFPKGEFLLTYSSMLAKFVISARRRGKNSCHPFLQDERLSKIEKDLINFFVAEEGDIDEIVDTLARENDYNLLFRVTDLLNPDVGGLLPSDYCKLSLVLYSNKNGWHYSVNALNRTVDQFLPNLDREELLSVQSCIKKIAPLARPASLGRLAKIKLIILDKLDNTESVRNFLTVEEDDK